MIFDMTGRKQNIPPDIDFIITNVMVPALTTHTDARFVHSQIEGSTYFEVDHGLDKYPSVTFIDSSNTQVIGDVTYLDTNRVVCSFKQPFIGSVLFN